MATSASNEASEIRRRGRQRLIGAVAIVLLLVVFVPMILDSEPRPARNEPALAIPPKENPPPLPPPTPRVATPASVAAPAPVATPAPPVAEPPKAASVTPVPAAKSAARAPKLEGFAVQIGAFREEEKLRQARDKLAAAGIVHYTERLENPAGALTRLRAGPYATREAADAAAEKLRGISLQGQVVPLP
jgi:DedD protein